MKFPTTAEEVKNELFKSVDLMNQIGDLRIRQLIKILSKVDDSIIVEGIILVFENENRNETHYNDQISAGMILKICKPRTEMNVELILNRILKNWNKSVEELPFWLKDNYGIETLKNAFSKIENKNLSAVEVDKTNTMKWWLRIKQDHL